MIVLALALGIATLETGRVIDRRVTRFVGAEQVDGDAEVEIDIALNGRQIDHAGGAQRGRVVGFQVIHDVAGAFDNARHAGLTDKHVVRFLGQHEARGARQRVEARLGQGVQLVLAVAVGEIGKHVKRQPVGCLFVEGLQDARVVFLAAAAFEQGFPFLAPVAAEILVQQVNHGPQVAAFLDVDLEQVAQIVQARRGQSEVALLFDRGRLGIALGDDDATQIGAVFARYALPGVFTLMVTEMDFPVRFGRVQKYSPAVLGHFDITELRPAVFVDAGCGAQVNVHVLRFLGAHVLPPFEVVGLPVLECAFERAVTGEVHVVRYFFVVING